jgi:hypothetical protein
LAISKSIVESQGGRIWANGDGEPGATFHFTLPAVPAETNPPVDLADSAFSTVSTRAQSASFDA